MVYKSREEFKRLGWIHRWNAIATIVLVVTGLLLYAEPLRGLLSPIRVAMKNLHIYAGLALALFALVTLLDWGRFMSRAHMHRGRRLNTVLTIVWLVGWTVTGLMMWVRGLFPSESTNIATTLHGWLTWVAIPWMTLHIAFRLERVRRLDERLARETSLTGAARYVLEDWIAAPATRRAVLWTGFATMAMLVLGRFFRPAKAEAELVKAGELPPVDPATLAGGGMRGRFRLYFINDTIPRFDEATWNLKVGDKTYSWKELLALPKVAMVSNFHCVTGWSVLDITWEGVLMKDILADAGFAQSKAMLFYSGDGEYTDSLTWEQAQQEGVILAYSMEGRPIPAVNGGPVKLVVPDMYTYKSVKWVERVVPWDDPNYEGYWQLRGYKTNAYLENGEKVKATVIRS